MGGFSLPSLVHFFNFQQRHVSVAKQYFYWEQQTFFIELIVKWVNSSEKKPIKFLNLKSSCQRLANTEKVTFPLKKYFKTSKDIIIGTKAT